MFTGLVEEIGIVHTVNHYRYSRRFTISAHKVVNDVNVDDSICINGVCQTVIQYDPSSFVVQAVDETLRKTNFGNLKIGDPVNLERSLRPTDRMGGHFVQGHVDGTAKVVRIEPQSAGKLLSLELPEQLLSFVVPLGSIALDGVSLTVARLQGNLATIALIPHTLACTNFKHLKPGSILNVETDLIGRYIVKQLAPYHKGALSQKMLEESGYSLNDNS